MAPNSSTLAWKIPWAEEPGGLQSMVSRRVRHDWATSLSRIGERNGNPVQCSCLENPRDGGAWWAAIYGVTQSHTWLKWLSSSSSTLVQTFRNTVWYIILQLRFQVGKRNTIYLDFMFLFCVIKIITFINILSLCYLEGMSSDLRRRSIFLKVYTKAIIHSAG